MVRRVVGEKLVEQLCAELGVQRAKVGQLRGGELFQRSRLNAANSVARLVRRRHAEAADVRVTEGRSVAQLEDEFLVRIEHERLGQREDGGARLLLVESLRGPAVARVVVEHALDVAVFARALLVSGGVGDRTGH